MNTIYSALNIKNEKEFIKLVESLDLDMHQYIDFMSELNESYSGEYIRERVLEKTMMFGNGSYEKLKEQFSKKPFKRKLKENNNVLPSGTYNIIVSNIEVDDYEEGEYNIHGEKELTINHDVSNDLDEEIREAILEDMGEPINGSIEVINYDYRIIDKNNKENLEEETVYDHSWYEVKKQKYPKRTKNGVEIKEGIKDWFKKDNRKYRIMYGRNGGWISKDMKYIKGDIMDALIVTGYKKAQKICDKLESKQKNEKGLLHIEEIKHYPEEKDFIKTYEFLDIMDKLKNREMTVEEIKKYLKDNKIHTNIDHYLMVYKPSKIKKEKEINENYSNESEYKVGQKLMYKKNGTTYVIDKVKGKYYDIKDTYSNKVYPVYKNTLDSEFKLLKESLEESVQGYATFDNDKISIPVKVHSIDWDLGDISDYNSESEYYEVEEEMRQKQSFVERYDIEISEIQEHLLGSEEDDIIQTIFEILGVEIEYTLHNKYNFATYSWDFTMLCPSKQVLAIVKDKLKLPKDDVDEPDWSGEITESFLKEEKAEVNDDTTEIKEPKQKSSADPEITKFISTTSSVVDNTTNSDILKGIVDSIDMKLAIVTDIEQSNELSELKQKAETKMISSKNIEHISESANTEYKNKELTVELYIYDIQWDVSSEDEDDEDSWNTDDYPEETKFEYTINLQNMLESINEFNVEDEEDVQEYIIQGLEDNINDDLDDISGGTSVLGYNSRISNIEEIIEEIKSNLDEYTVEPEDGDYEYDDEPIISESYKDDEPTFDVGDNVSFDWGNEKISGRVVKTSYIKNNAYYDVASWNNEKEKLETYVKIDPISNNMKRIINGDDDE